MKESQMVEIPIVPLCAVLNDYDSPIVWQRGRFLWNNAAIAREMAEKGLGEIKIAWEIVKEEKRGG